MSELPKAMWPDFAPLLGEHNAVVKKVEVKTNNFGKVQIAVNDRWDLYQFVGDVVDGKFKLDTKDLTPCPRCEAMYLSEEHRDAIAQVLGIEILT